MKLNLLTIHEQCVAISCSTRALQDLYEDLDTIVATRKIGLPYVIKMLCSYVILSKKFFCRK